MAARKKGARKKSAVTKQVTTGLVALDSSLQEEFAPHIARDAKTAKAGLAWPFISLANRTLNYGGVDVGDELDVIILGAINENIYYATAYDAENVGAPDCFALGFDEDSMAPPADLDYKVSAACRGCPNDAFGSADNGRGKACGNKVRLVLLPADKLTPKVLADVDGARIRVPTMSIAGKVPNGNYYSPYVNKLTTFGRPLFSVVTKLKVVPDPKSQFRLTFAIEKDLGADTELLRILLQRAKESTIYLEAEPSRRTDEAEGDGKAGPRKRKVNRRKSSGSKKKAAAKRPAGARY